MRTYKVILLGFLDGAVLSAGITLSPFFLILGSIFFILVWRKL